ncbi:precorrin-6y C5,15-methyltransferase (decarboxylating) subunit CbiE [Sedimentibacter hydroxybenzoicus DSM 7310]|uniref:Precorrin-6y C5,15-methyltransferase (Decarboxylating) subunit CbiE n=1 Tax=Sedimentibacter hydroxybenzoicus DSM 7310 TaxID=1123245 RepID=A0A974BKM0_SEDHY|nr:precorrin-6y C5,15-methyltransferase (decarboxylating) subunit CbiE [Sedimentibacter hydroxybenzoicus]NYB75044.1 precorrin-6y C5,15-methyltransferase (decarboxylating) subunit CbiE [Sedimentibacter hydroxybenzoicus DSM 7310]
MKKVSIIGLGIGNLSYIHNKAIETIKSCDCLIGAKRMLKDFMELNKQTYESSNAESICNYIAQGDYKSYGILVSGDSGFYSLSKKITEILGTYKDIRLENIPAISSLQYFSSKLNIPWDDIKYVSAHGRNLNIISNVIFNKKTFILTSGDFGPGSICEILTSKGLGHLKVSVGEKLSYDDERIVEGEAHAIAEMTFDGLAVMIVHNDDYISADEAYRSIKDEEFVTGKAPMTKSEVRTVSIGKLNLKSDYTVYDIGAGTGSVSVETALKLNNGTLYAVERDDDTAYLIEKNIEKFRMYNVEVIRGTAPEAIENLPKPDACFIGGSSGNMDEIINTVLQKNPYVNVVINTITLQSLNEAISCMEKYRFNDVEIVSITAAKSKKMGRYDLMMGQNPIYIISGKGSGVL